jgi:hypothetical protein
MLYLFRAVIADLNLVTTIVMQLFSLVVITTTNLKALIQITFQFQQVILTKSSALLSFNWINLQVHSSFNLQFLLQTYLQVNWSNLQLILQYSN